MRHLEDILPQNLRRQGRFVGNLLVYFLMLVSGRMCIAQTIPANDDDLTLLTKAIQAAGGSVNGCQLHACAQFECKDAIALSQALGSTQGTLQALAPALHDYFTQQMKKADELNGEYERNNSRDELVRRSYILSKLSSDTARLALTVASFGEALSGVNEYVENIERVSDFSKIGEYSEALRDAADANLASQVLSSTTNGLGEGFAALKADYDDYHGMVDSDPSLDDHTENLIALTSGIKDVASATSNFMTQLRLYRAQLNAAKGMIQKGMTLSTEVEKLEGAREALQSSWTGGVIQVVGKLGLAVAATQQDKLMDEIQEIARVQGALNKNFASNMQDATRTVNRYKMVMDAIAKLRPVYTKSRICMEQCPNPPAPVPPPKLVPAKGDTKGELDYSAVLQQYNKLIPAATDTITSAAAKFKVKGGITPTISVETPVRTGVKTIANYAIGSCKETENAEIHLLDAHYIPNTKSDTPLGTATRGKDASVDFTAPLYKGTYKILIRNEQSGVLARTQFEIAENAKTQCEWLPGWELSMSPRDINFVTGHLPPRSLEFKTGTPGKPGFLHGRLVVTPGVNCSSDAAGFPVFGGASEWTDYFNIEVLRDSVPPFNASADGYYPDQRVTKLKVYFDGGKTAESTDPSKFSFPDKDGKVVRIEMSFDFMGTKSTLTWSKP